MILSSLELKTTWTALFGGDVGDIMNSIPPYVDERTPPKNI